MVSKNIAIITLILLVAQIMLSSTLYVGGFSQSYGADDQVPFYVSWIIHIHQPYYNVNGSLLQLLYNNPPSWLPDVWRTRSDIYMKYIPWIALNMSGDCALQVDITGTLIDQLNELEQARWDNCRYCGWKNHWIQAVNQKTQLGYPKLRILGAGYYHPIFPLISRSEFKQDFIEQVLKHERIIRENFGIGVDKGFFLIEESYSPEIIPWIAELGFEWIVIDSEQVLRATKGYNSVFEPEPNQYDVRNPDPRDWDWGISPQLVFRPHVVSYNGSSIVAFVRYRHMSQAEMSGTNVDYLINQIKHFQTYNTDPKRPFIMVIVHDGENGFPYKEWGGSYGYDYYVNYLLKFIKRVKSDPQLSFIKIIGLTEYLEKIYDPRKDDEYVYANIYAEPGSWETMSTWGDPDFSMWNYPDINSADQARWSQYIEAINYYMTAYEGIVDKNRYQREFETALDWIMRGETSCYYYWDGNDWWDRKALDAFTYSKNIIERILREVSVDKTPPTIRWAWRSPYNPGRTVEIYIQAFDYNGLSSVYAEIYREGEYIDRVELTKLSMNNFYKLSYKINEAGVYNVVIYAIDKYGNTRVYRGIRPFYANPYREGSQPTGEGVFNMDGLLDESILLFNNTRNKYVKEIWVSMVDNYLYVATNGIPQNTDLFIFISIKPDRMIDPPWRKQGKVAEYVLYIGVEGSNGWSGWFLRGDHLITEDCGSYVGEYVEGYINIKKHIGENVSEIYLAVGVYESNDGGRLLETLYDHNGDQNIDSDEYVKVDLVSLRTLSKTIYPTSVSSKECQCGGTNTWIGPGSSAQPLSSTTSSRDTVVRSDFNNILAVIVLIVIAGLIAYLLKNKPKTG